ncbi:hypothetical protein BCR33DRAFT_716724 [Rhizoclosmatium globosum]|uniref:Stress response regulator protein 1 n=1 Tax=Rhizoclosmatium globosum TaxID=329046 RepID=A0A1Y2CCK4_9FUNG|nr:hypothetical protein BCR33DRAFT_716724 [Rhizoclosmatium globosum]|eukprot:ORY44763.1 hypothetical protein BCR33DRAFT_716724 [Rhizoclosmatium globosum]
MKGCHSDRVVTNMEVFTTISSNLYSHDEKNEYLNSLTERIRLMNSRQMMASDQVSDSSVSFVKLDTQSNKSFRSSNLELSQSENAIDTELLSILSFPQKQVKRKLLIADKSQDFRSEFQRIVTSLTTDYEVLEASSCDEVILIMDNIDIVFIDMTMPNLPEYAELRKFQHTFVPVVGVCEALESIQKHQLDPLGLNYIITKPISKGILMSLLKTFNTSRNKPIQKTPSPSRSLYSSFFPSPRIGMETPVESMKSEFSFMSTPRIYENRSGSISPQSITLDIFYQEPSSDLNRDLIHALVVESSFPQRQTLVKTISKFTIFQDIFEASNEVDASRLCSARKFSMIFIGVHPDTTDINDIIRKCRNEGIPVITLMDINSGSCKLESSATLYRPVSSKELENAIRGILPELKVDCQDNGGTAINEEGKRKESVATLVGIHS